MNNEEVVFITPDDLPPSHQNLVWDAINTFEKFLNVKGDEIRKQFILHPTETMRSLFVSGYMTHVARQDTES